MASAEELFFSLPCCKDFGSDCPGICCNDPNSIETESELASFPGRRRYDHAVWLEDVDVPETVLEILPADTVVVVNSMVRKERLTPPDGGFGWAVVAAAFLISFLLSGFLKSISAFTTVAFEEFPALTSEEAARITDLISTLSLGFSIASGLLVTSLGSGPLVLMGGLSCSTGMAIGYFANSKGFLIWGLGVFVGIGSSLAITSSIVSVARYFARKRSIAMALALSGGCVGALILPAGIEGMLPIWGLRRTFLVLAGVFQLISVSSLVFRAPEKQFRKVFIQVPIYDMGDVSEPLEDVNVFTRVARLVAERLALRFLKDPKFQLTCTTVFALAVGNCHSINGIPQFAKSLGVEDQSASVFLVCAAVGDLVIRLSYGVLACRSPLPRAAEYAASFLISATSMVLIPFCTSYWHLITTSVMAGVGTGLWSILIPLLLTNMHGEQNLAGTFALVRLFQGCARLLCPPAFGELRFYSVI